MSKNIFFFIFYFQYVNSKNIFNLGYILEPMNRCNNQTFLLIYVHSSPENLKNRLKIRETWGNLNNLENDQVKLLFTCGLSKDNKVNDLLKLESATYNDILQINFFDTYRNLTIKGGSTLKWIANNCKDVLYILKVDDDVYVNTKLLTKHLKLRSGEEKEDKSSILCYVHKKMKVIRDKKSKWFVSTEEFPNKYYSNYCSGSAFIMNRHAVLKLAKFCYNAKFFWIDDYFFTGRMAKLFRIDLIEFNSVYILKTNKSKQALKNNQTLFLFAHFGHKRNSIDYF